MPKGKFKVDILRVTKSGLYTFPEKCLRSTIKNDGDSRIFIYNGIELLPGQSFPIPDIPNMYLVDDIKVSVMKPEGKYTDKTIVSFINLIEQ